MAKNDCPHNPGIICTERGRRCQTCGWSPEVAARRKKSQAGEKAETPTTQDNHRAPNCRAVAKVNEAGAVLEVYPSIVDAAKANYMTEVGVKTHLRGKVKKPFKCTGGYTFRYAD